MKKVRRIGVLALLALLVADAPTNASICGLEFCGGYTSYMRGSGGSSFRFVVGSLSQSMPFLWKRGFTFTYPTYSPYATYSSPTLSGWTGSYLRAGSSFSYLGR
jgi:hypothetical protein